MLRLLPEEFQTDRDIMYTFINGLEEDLRIKLMSKEEVTTYEDATKECWRYYMSKGYGQDEYRTLQDSNQPVELDRYTSRIQITLRIIFLLTTTQIDLQFPFHTLIIPFFIQLPILLPISLTLTLQ